MIPLEAGTTMEIDLRQTEAVHHTLHLLAQVHPNEPAVTFTRGNSYSASEILRRAQTMADAMYAHGLRPGDRVALMLSNRIEFLDVWFGASLAGVVSVPLSCELKGDILQYMLSDCAPTAIVYERQYSSNINDAFSTRGKPMRIEVDGEAEDTEYYAWIGQLPEQGSAAESPLLTREPDELMSILYTSGTTGPSKGVMLSHGAVQAKAAAAEWVFDLTENDRLYTCLPLYHANALYTSLLAGLRVGAHVTIAPRFSASNYWNDIRSSQATVTNMLGSMAAILWQADASELDSAHCLRRVIASPNPSYFHAFQSRFGVELAQIYGLTDMGIPLGTPPGEVQPDSCGRRLPWWDCRIVDDKGYEVEDGVVGELVLRPLVPGIGTHGYWEKPEATLRTLKDLWFHTGDLLKRDPDGWFYFVDRQKDSVRRSGENVSTFEVEQVIRKHPSVSEVAVYSLPSDLSEDEVAAAIVLRTGSSVSQRQIICYCEDRLPYFAVPRYITLVAELPRTPTQKVRKDILKVRGTSDATFDAGPRNRRAIDRPRSPTQDLPTSIHESGEGTEHA